MKCPKCGFNSFEYYDTCKKCSSDLVGYKQTHSISSLVLPGDAKEKLAVDYRDESGTPDDLSDANENHTDIFSFNLPDESSPTPDSPNSDPFSFAAPSTDAATSDKSHTGNDFFADLLESTTKSAGPELNVKTTDTFAQESGNGAESSSTTDEFDTQSFAWDDTPIAAASTNSQGSNNVDSLFGDLEEANNK
jgi:hypothetical protein